MVLIPEIGTQGSQRMLIALSAASALCVLVPLVRSKHSEKGSVVLSGSYDTGRGFPPCLDSAGSAGAVVAYGRLFKPLASNSRILYVGEGLNSTIAVSEWGRSLQFHVSGKVEASTGADDMRVQRMLGDLPGLVYANPRIRCSSSGSVRA